jgi:hypothetical protein
MAHRGDIFMHRIGNGRFNLLDSLQQRAFWFRDSSLRWNPEAAR